MAAMTGILPDDIASSPSRQPLQCRTSSPNLSKRVRRKTSFVRLSNSSEEYPSPHDSIYEAAYISITNSDSSGNRIELVDIAPSKHVASAVNVLHNDENRKAMSVSVQELPSINDVQFRYGHGTLLETITEQRSYATIRTAGRRKSADDVPQFLDYRDSFNLVKGIRRKASFSLDDVFLVQQSYHEACSTIERRTYKLPIEEIYAEPKTPIRGPPERPPTPDGMPSWTASQSPRPVPPLSAQTAFERFFGLRASGLTSSSRVPQASSNPRVESTTVRGRVAPRFRPPRSAYGPIDQHPFANAPIAQVKDAQSGREQMSGTYPTIARPRKAKGQGKLQRVRFTPSATARDSEMLSFQTAIESTTGSAVHPLDAHMQAVPITAAPSSGGCPHQGRRRAPQSVTTNPEPQSWARTELPVPSSPVGSSAQMTRSSKSLRSLVVEDPQSRTPSFSSTAHLMSGGLGSPSGPIPHRTADTQSRLPGQKDPFCWKCAAKKTGEKIDQWLKLTTSCLCFVCCGLDIEDDTSTQYSGSTFVSQEYMGPRRVISEYSPAVIL